MDKMKLVIKIFSLFFIVLFFAGCETTKPTVNVHGEKPLIDTSKVISDGKKQIEKKVKDGPKPIENSNNIKTKRKTITTQNVKNYVSIPDDFTNLKQKISINFQGLDFSYVMSLMAELGNINILVGDEVSGTVTAKIDNVSWDTAFQTILDMKTLVADVNAADGIIRVHTPEKLTEQETAKSARAEVLKKKIELEESVEPILAEIFRLYYISPAQAKTTLEDLFASQGEEGAAVMNNLKITVEDTTRSIIVRGQKEDLDVIDAVIKEIDVKTKQVLIEAFIVDVTSTFAKELGTRIGAMSKKGVSGEKGSTVVTGTIGGSATTPGGISIGAAAGTVTNNSITGATSGIGIIKTFGTAALKVELEALQSLGLNEILSSPSVFTLNNQEATITQGDQIPYQTTSDGTTTTEFKEAALSLTVTPSIIGDGNVLLDIQVNNDAPKEIAGADEPGISTNEIKTKLLVTDGDIVVIGGIKKNTKNNVNKKTPGLGDAPVIGNLFKSKEKSDELKELLIFIAPRVIQ